MPSNKIIVGFVGEICSGKGTAAEYLRKKYDGVMFKFSTVMRDVLDRLYLEQTRENLQALSLCLRQTFGQDLFAKTMARDAAASTAQVTIIDGIRRPGDVMELAKLKDFHLINITAGEKTRFERIKTRNENPNDAAKTWEQFQKEEKAEPESKIREIAATAKYTIDNNGTIEELHKRLDDVITKIKG